MAIPIKCPGCQAAFEVPESLGGKTIRCTSCKTQLPVPSAKAAPAAKSAPMARPAPPGGSGGPPAAGGGLGGAPSAGGLTGGQIPEGWVTTRGNSYHFATPIKPNAHKLPSKDGASGTAYECETADKKGGFAVILVE